MSAKHLIAWIFSLLASMPNGYVIADEYAPQRQKMVAEIKDNVRQAAEFINAQSFETRVMEALDTVPRHEFVPKESRSRAYENRPLAIGYGQTISQPYIVALMTDLLQPQPWHMKYFW